MVEESGAPTEVKTTHQSETTPQQSGGAFPTRRAAITIIRRGIADTPRRHHHNPAGYCRRAAPPSPSSGRVLPTRRAAITIIRRGIADATRRHHHNPAGHCRRDTPPPPTLDALSRQYRLKRRHRCSFSRVPRHLSLSHHASAQPTVGTKGGDDPVTRCARRISLVGPASILTPTRTPRSTRPTVRKRV